MNMYNVRLTLPYGASSIQLCVDTDPESEDNSAMFMPYGHEGMNTSFYLDSQSGLIYYINSNKVNQYLTFSFKTSYPVDGYALSFQARDTNNVNQLWKFNTSSSPQRISQFTGKNMLLTYFPDYFRNLACVAPQFYNPITLNEQIFTVTPTK